MLLVFFGRVGFGFDVGFLSVVCRLECLFVGGVGGVVFWVVMGWVYLGFGGFCVLVCVEFCVLLLFSLLVIFFGYCWWFVLGGFDFGGVNCCWCVRFSYVFGEDY